VEEGARIGWSIERGERFPLSLLFFFLSPLSPLCLWLAFVLLYFVVLFIFSLKFKKYRERDKKINIHTNNGVAEVHPSFPSLPQK